MKTSETKQTKKRREKWILGAPVGSPQMDAINLHRTQRPFINYFRLIVLKGEVQQKAMISHICSLLTFLTSCSHGHVDLITHLSCWAYCTVILGQLIIVIANGAAQGYSGTGRAVEPLWARIAHGWVIWLWLTTATCTYISVKQNLYHDCFKKY